MASFGKTSTGQERRRGLCAKTLPCRMRIEKVAARPNHHYLILDKWYHVRMTFGGWTSYVVISYVNSRVELDEGPIV